jgi:hypothetical protein
MSEPETSAKPLASLSPRPALTIKPGRIRLVKLSAPKIRLDKEEEIVGPGSYDPSEAFLSTKVKSPSVSICRSDRFLSQKVSKLRFQLKKLDKTPDISDLVYKLSDIVTPPKYSFKRTGHNLILVKNPGFPGAGHYSSREATPCYSYSFSKAKKNFNWKKGES